MTEKKFFRRKICLLGDAAVGKTSLIKRYVQDKFDDKYIVTLGTKVTMKEVDIRIPEKNEIVNITLMVWDILGQREFKRLQTSYYRGANGAMVVADFTRKETLASIHGWILSLFNNVGKVPILLLINKSDLLERAAITSDDISDAAEKYNIPHMLTSAKTGENVEKAFLKMSEMLVKTDGKADQKRT